MQYQKIANLLENTSDNLSKSRTRNWIEMNYKSRGDYANGDIKLKTTMLRSNLCNQADPYILVKGTTTITGSAGLPEGRPEAQLLAARQADERDKEVTFKKCAPLTKCISRINNTDIDNAHDIDIVILMYNLIKCSDNYSKTSGSLWQYCKDDANGNIEDSQSFKSKLKITKKTPNNGNTKGVEIIVPLKYLSNFSKST